MTEPGKGGAMGLGRAGSGFALGWPPSGGGPCRACVGRGPYRVLDAMERPFLSRTGTVRNDG